MNDTLYQPIEATVQSLSDSIEMLSGGYIALLGTPGSGKSTLLTKTLRSLPQRVVSYYAYVPESSYPSTLRGESESFLHDVVFQLERMGFAVGQSTNALDREQLLTRFHEQISLLSSNWQSSGLKTIILVDGLDHVDRELNPERSFLDDLPTPDQVPEGVYFVLGTQTDAPIPTRIKSSLQESYRRIQMEPLQRPQVHAVLEAASLEDKITPQQEQVLYQLSAGHPLALAYMVNRISLGEEAESLIAELEGGAPFEGDIGAAYHSYWTQFSDDDELCSFLGLLARMRGAIEIPLVRKWADDSLVDRLGKRFAHFFRLETPQRWHFFHNSFRLFVIRKTAEFPEGFFEEQRDREFHKKLADLCSHETDFTAKSWEELFHRASAGQHSEVLGIATQDYFRRQFFEFRPIEAIHSDILLAMKSAAIRHDPIALSLLCLIDSEMAQRDFHSDPLFLVSILLNLDRPSLAIEQLRSGRRLYVKASTALQAAVLLKEHGLGDEAKQLFELAEPLELLYGSTTDTHPDPDELAALMQEWVKAAAWFHDLDKLIGIIQQGRHHARQPSYMNNESADDSLESGLLFLAGLELIRQQRWSDLSMLFSSFDSIDEENTRARFWLHFHVCGRLHALGNNSRAAAQLHEMSAIDVSSLGDEEATALAQTTLLISKDIEDVRSLLIEVKQPPLKKDLGILEQGLRPFKQRLALNSLLYVLGERRTPSEIIPDSPDPRDRGVLLFERGLCTVSHFQGRGWINRHLEESDLEYQALPLLRLFYRSSEETRRWNSWYAIKSVRNDFYSLIVHAVAQHGRGALQKLFHMFVQEWDSPDFKHYWPIGDRRQVIQAFVENGIEHTLATEQLLGIDDLISRATDMEPSERVEELMRLAEAWIQIGNREKAEGFLISALSAGFGISYAKDYQLDQWVEWLGKVNSVEQNLASQRISEFALSIENVNESTDGAAASSAAEKLLAVAYAWSPVRSIRLFTWFLDRGLINHETGVCTLLTEALKSSRPPAIAISQVVSEFLFAYAVSGHSDLSTLLLKTLGRSVQEPKLIEETRSLVSKVRLYSNSSTRSQLLKGLKRGIDEVGLSGYFPDLGDESPDSFEVQEPTFLRLRETSEPMSNQEVLEQTFTVADIQRLVENESENSMFDWRPAIVKVAQNSQDKDSLRHLAEQLKSSWRGCELVAHISLRLNDLGYSEYAWETGLEALRASRHYGWIPRTDGGTRIIALKTLATIDRVKTVPLIYRTLIGDLQDHHGLSADIAAVLDDILELLDPAVDVTKVWKEVDEHTSTLLSKLTPPNSVNLFSQDESRDIPIRAILELMVAHLNHPCRPLAQAAQRTLGKLLISHTEDVCDVLKNSLGMHEDTQERALMLIHAVSLRNAASMSCIQGQVSSLFSSSNWSVRQICASVFDQCNWEEPAMVLDPAALPPIYGLSLAPQLLSLPPASVQPEPGNPLANSDDPFVITIPYHEQIALISEIAGVPEQNIRRRIVEIIHVLAPGELDSSSLIERQLRSCLNSAGLRLPFERPRVKLVRKALLHAVAELVDAGRISDQDLPTLEVSLRSYDPRMVLCEPSSKPTQIKPLSEVARNDDLKVWLDESNDSLPALDWSPSEQHVIIAEETRLEFKGIWATLSEARYSVLEQVYSSVWLVGSVPIEMFGVTENGLISENPTSIAASVVPRLVNHNATLGFFTPGPNWLAFNPNLARELGWSYSPDGLFRWVDSQGQTMVESIWWMDGQLSSLVSRGRAGGAGEGWVVVASILGLKAIRERFGSLFRKSRVVRQTTQESKSDERSASSRRAI